jgi:hypothetical protein
MAKVRVGRDEMKTLERKTIDLIVTALLAGDEREAVAILNKADGSAEGFFAQRAFFMRDQLLGDAEKALKRAVRAYRTGNVETAEHQLFFTDAILRAVERAWLNH